MERIDMSTTNLKQLAICECGNIMDEALNGKPSYKLINSNPDVMQETKCSNCSKTRSWKIKTFTVDGKIELIKGHTYWVLSPTKNIEIGQFNGMHKFAQNHSWYILGEMGGEHTGDLIINSGDMTVLGEIILPLEIFESLSKEIQEIEIKKKEKYLKTIPIIPYQKIISGVK